MSTRAHTTTPLPAEATGLTLAAWLRQSGEVPWSTAKKWCMQGKVSIDGRVELSPSFRLREGMLVAVDMHAKPPRNPWQKQAEELIVYEDSQLVVINKPAGISSVPYEDGETDTAMDLIRTAWRLQKRTATRSALHIVHRIDKETSGLLVFAKTKGCERFLQQQLRQHAMERTYLCVVHGLARNQRIESLLVPDRGDGLRGSARNPAQRAVGKRAITHVTVVKHFRHASLCQVQLETGKTHQIRIHLAEKGHPLLGEKVYIRDYLRQHDAVLPAPRLMLHAQTLGFAHPVSEKTMSFSAPPPPAFQRTLDELSKAPRPTRLATRRSSDAPSRHTPRETTSAVRRTKRPR